MEARRGVMTILAVAALAVVAFGTTVASGLPPKAGGRVYANDELWATFGTANFKGGPSVSMDTIFVFPEDGNLIPVAEASPGDPDYNGGRWEVREVRFTGIPPEQFTNDEDVWLHYSLGHVSISGIVMRFECPLFHL